MSKENLEKTKKVEDTQEVVQKPKKSELLKEQISLEKQYTDGTYAMLEETYSVKVGTKGNFDRLSKYIEHDADFDHSTAIGISLLYSNLKQQKPFTREDDWNGVIQLKTSSCLVLWKSLMTYHGKGFFEVKSFLEMIQFQWIYQRILPNFHRSGRCRKNLSMFFRLLHSLLLTLKSLFLDLY